MKYAIVKVSNGNYFIESEGYTDLNKAKVQFHSVCQAMWNAPDVISGCVMIADENLDAVEGYKEVIRHDTVEVPEEETEQTEEQ